MNRKKTQMTTSNFKIDMYNVSVSPTGGWNFLSTLGTRDMLIANITFELKLLTLFSFSVNYTANQT